MTQEMRFNDDWFALARLKHHAIDQKAHARRNGLSIQMLVGVLKEVRFSPKAVTPAIRRSKCNAGKRLPCLQRIVFAQQLAGLFHQTHRLLTNTIALKRCRPLSFGQEPNQIANARGLIFGTWWWVIYESNDAVPCDA